MMTSQEYILSLCEDPNVVYASIHEEDGKTYITIDCDDGTSEDPYYGYDGRLSTWKYGPRVIEAVKALVCRLNAAA
jgi:uncharacterized radical SAM superfamily Fe-S cluster-containing enzyme